MASELEEGWGNSAGGEEAGGLVDRVTQVTLTPEGGAIYDERAWTVAICDEGGGEFVIVSDGEGKSVRIDESEWPSLRDAINKMVLKCRTKP